MQAFPESLKNMEKVFENISASCFLEIGITLAILSLLGTTPVDIDKLNINVRGFTISFPILF